MDRQTLILLALGAVGEDAAFTPVQVQKLFFLIDRELGPQIGGPHFGFQPYDYGPFDGAVYRDLEMLSYQGFVHIERVGALKHYRLTAQGFAEAKRRAPAADARALDYFFRAAQWVRSLGFADLVSAIYRKYPDMKVNSVFQR
jgi:hypothetical protein